MFHLPSGDAFLKPYFIFPLATILSQMAVTSLLYALVLQLKIEIHEMIAVEKMHRFHA